MKFLLSLDYEIFFGSRTGSVENCLIKPVNALLETVAPYGCKLSLFVDAGFLLRLSEQAEHYPHLLQELDIIKRQLESLIAKGHDVQLHIHPHWEDSYFDGTRWQIITKRYKLHDFAEDEILRITHRYKDILAKITGSAIFAYRAGGWCLQPFDKIAHALQCEGVWLDSTVFLHGLSEDEDRWFDFRGAPAKPFWTFTDNPVQPDENGSFVEVPISSFSVLPTFFFKMVAARLMKSSGNTCFGDGVSMEYGKSYYIQRLTRPTNSPASIDGLKADLLQNAFQQHQRHKRGEIFHVMGHPKALFRNSLRSLNNFLQNNKKLEPITFKDLQYLKPPLS